MGFSTRMTFYLQISIVFTLDWHLHEQQSPSFNDRFVQSLNISTRPSTIKQSRDTFQLRAHANNSSMLIYYFFLNNPIEVHFYFAKVISNFHPSLLFKCSISSWRIFHSKSLEPTIHWLFTVQYRYQTTIFCLMNNRETRVSTFPSTLILCFALRYVYTCVYVY